MTEHKWAEELLSGLSRRLMDAHEKERTRIARELHDDIGQQTALLTIELERLRQLLPQSASEPRQLVQDLHARTVELGKDVQAISHRLHSSKLDYLGIEAAAASFCKEVSDQQQVTIEFRDEGIPEHVPKDIALGLYRVLQEAISNAVKHARVSRVTVTLRGTGDEIELEVVDTGSGFNPNAAMRGGGLGLISMPGAAQPRERQHLDSSRGSGREPDPRARPAESAGKRRAGSDWLSLRDRLTPPAYARFRASPSGSPTSSA